ncbi:endo-1,5-alpha-L-arabinosidase [Lichtheimia hyalospora FSU 10163]|nr:endo-1,5-alpha-L-arabinosidase [Lichtheimia hyalospora FSU 10163]
MLLGKITTGILFASSLLISQVHGDFWNLSGDIGCHDPTIIKEGSTWFAFCTGDGIQARFSNDKTTWQSAAQIFLSAPSWWASSASGHSGLDVWAPDAKVFNNRVYLYYAISSFGSQNSAIGLASADSIQAGSWRDDGVVLKSTSSNDYNAIDPELVIDTDGKPWLAFGSFWSGLKITELDPATMKPYENAKIYSIAANPNDANAIEAASIVYHDGYYYLFASIDKCCSGVDSTYKIVVSRSKSITGPYLDKNGVDAMQSAGTIFDTGNDKWIGPGGQDVNDGVIARHAYDAEDNGAPKLLINDLNWSGGWPTY